MTQPSAFEPVHTPPPEPERGPGSWLLALVVVLIVVAVGVGVGAILAGPRPVATPSPPPAAVASPSPTATETATPTQAPSPSPTAVPTDRPPATAAPTGDPSATLPADVRAEIDDVVAQIPGLRELEPQRDVPYEFVTREQFQADLVGLVDEDTDPEQLAAEERLLKRLGLLPQELDLRETILELYGSQVAAFYRPDTGTFYIIGQVESLGPVDQMIVAHEYTHALQDQHFDLEGTRITDPSEGDAALAQLAAVEGDASLLMILFGVQTFGFDGLMEAFSDSLNPGDQELLQRMPLILRRQLEFPYGDGSAFSTQVWQRGGWGAIDETISSPPTSTEQVLHPDKYFDGEEAVAVEIPDQAETLGAGWQRSYEQTMGELNLQVWVGGGEEPRTTLPGVPPVWPQADVAEGWGGDRLAMYESDAGGWAIVWELAWDTDDDAEDFLGRARQLQATLDGTSELVEVGPDRVRLLIAHDEPTLEALGSAFAD